VVLMTPLIDPPVKALPQSLSLLQKHLFSGNTCDIRYRNADNCFTV